MSDHPDQAPTPRWAYNGGTDRLERVEPSARHYEAGDPLPAPTAHLPPTSTLAATEPTGGTKADTGKLRYDLVPGDSFQELVEVLTMGANKYAPRNWEKGIDFHRPFAAMLRHAWSWWRGENTDPESGLSHMAHVACNALFLCSYELRDMVNGEFDDRPVE